MPSSFDDPEADEWYEAGIAAFKTDRLIDIVDEKTRGFSDEYFDDQPFSLPAQTKSISMPNIVDLNGYGFGTYTDDDGNPIGDLTSVSIPSAKLIYACTFSTCPNLVSVDVGSAVFVGRSAFKRDRKLESIDLPNVVSLGMELI